MRESKIRPKSGQNILIREHFARSDVRAFQRKPEISRVAISLRYHFGAFLVCGGVVFPRLQLSAILGIAAALAMVCASRGFCQKAPTPNASHEDAPSAASQPSLTETQWNLTEVDGEPVTVQAARQPAIYLPSGTG